MVALVPMVSSMVLAGCAGLPGSPAAEPSSHRSVTSPSTAATPTTTPSSPALTSTTRPPTQPIVIGWAGDAIPASTRHALPGNPRTLLGSVAADLRSPDLMIVNLEGTLGSRGVSKCQRWVVPDCHAFQAPATYARTVFADSGVDAVNTANNHSYDYGDVGQADTRKALAGAGVAATGGVDEVTVVDVRGTRVALVGFATYGWAADLRDPAEVRALVRRARAAADVVVVMLHSGKEGTDAAHTPDRVEWHLGENRGNSRAVAHLAIDEGADLVVGSGPHVVRGMEVYQGRLIAYSLGNLVGYGGAFGVSGDLALSGILHVTIRPDGTLESGRLIPLRIGKDGIPRPDPAAGTLRRVRELSRADFGRAAVRVGSDGSLSTP
jgi:hypothetical protein